MMEIDSEARCIRCGTAVTDEPNAFFVGAEGMLCTTDGFTWPLCGQCLPPPGLTHPRTDTPCRCCFCGKSDSIHSDAFVAARPLDGIAPANVCIDCFPIECIVRALACDQLQPASLAQPPSARRAPVFASAPPALFPPPTMTTAHRDADPGTAHGRTADYESDDDADEHMGSRNAPHKRDDLFLSHRQETSFETTMMHLDHVDTAAVPCWRRAKSVRDRMSVAALIHTNNSDVSFS